jgi:hypothetical protein
MHLYGPCAHSPQLAVHFFGYASLAFLWTVVQGHRVFMLATCHVVYLIVVVMCRTLVVTEHHSSIALATRFLHAIASEVLLFEFVHLIGKRFPSTRVRSLSPPHPLTPHPLAPLHPHTLISHLSPLTPHPSPLTPSPPHPSPLS